MIDCISSISSIYSNTTKLFLGSTAALIVKWGYFTFLNSPVGIAINRESSTRMHPGIAIRSKEGYS